MKRCSIRRKSSDNLFRRVCRARITSQAQFYSWANPRRGHWLFDLLSKSR